MTSTSAFAFNGKGWCNGRQGAWHFIERQYTQSHGGPLKYAPSQDGPLQCEAVICCVFIGSPPWKALSALLKSLQLWLRESSEFSSSVPGRGLSFLWQNGSVHVCGIVSIVSSKHSHDPAVVVTSSRVLHDSCQGSCDRVASMACNRTGTWATHYISFIWSVLPFKLPFLSWKCKRLGFPFHLEPRYGHANTEAQL